MRLLLAELQTHFDLETWEPRERRAEMSTSAILYAIEFSNFLRDKEYDAILIRGDRYEMLGLAMIACYRGFKIIHIEGGDLSGVVDNKVRHAITHLSDLHFCTNEESHQRLITMGVSPSKVWNFGSLDVEYAQKVKKQRLKREKYILVAYHPIDGEEEKELDLALERYPEYDIIKIGSNTDYGKEYGHEEFSPEDYINLLRYAKVAIGNSSSLLKEASILGIPVVLVGERQKNRLLPKNLVQVPCERDKIALAIEFKLKYPTEKDTLYYKPQTSRNICQQIRKALN